MVAPSTTPRAGPNHPSVSPSAKRTSLRLNIAFFLFGLLNNSLYVVILTAALELLPQGVPTGLVSFANIFPALIAKAVWPYLLKGEVRYTKRVWSCAALSFVGMLLVSFFPALTMRLFGISLASFSSGLGELTFLQLSTRYAPKRSGGRRSGLSEVELAGAGLETNFAGDAVGWFASGTGAAGLVGAGAWWVVRPLGVQTGMAILSVLPGFMVLAYTVVLPSVEQLLEGGGKGGEYVPVSTDDDRTSQDDLDADADDSTPLVHPSTPDPATIRLSFAEKMSLLRPMLLPYILPLVTVYFAEYTINQGVAPTLIYPLPTPSNHPLLAHIIRKLTDYYPLYQLVYQTFVFLSRSSISIFHLPAIPRSLLWLPAILQTSLLAILTTESLYAWFRTSIVSPLVIVLICIEGLAGGAAYVSVFYSIGVDAHPHPPSGAEDEDETYRLAKKAQEHEFRIGCVGFGDSLGILAASIISMPLQVSLCNAQVRSGRELCKQA
ncbi:Batten's disease protein Cln3 [Kalmanozyma brasiliensis GHG001]|uniref:Protein BTN n=1 Tax=Kalmanozyma brasiliensis (strain GHG001) TaxID=1365824 RepID=V5F0I4_KALBG|nr:Batten's disease protein Cln3 [Kalmanozyma brasiliensis GHG001]EST08729.1 Batten's disease protein Cln3 [Kalmanozyma brasiliensis GHG001]